MLQILADRLLLQRKRSGLSQGDVKERTGLAASTISSYENCLSEPGATALVKLSHCYNCSVPYLLGIESNSEVLNLDGLDEIEIALLEEYIQVLRRAKGYPHTLKLLSYAERKYNDDGADAKDDLQYSSSGEAAGSDTES